MAKLTCYFYHNDTSIMSVDIAGLSLTSVYRKRALVHSLLTMLQIRLLMSNLIH